MKAGFRRVKGNQVKKLVQCAVQCTYVDAIIQEYRDIHITYMYDVEMNCQTHVLGGTRSWKTLVNEPHETQQGGRSVWVWDSRW